MNFPTQKFVNCFDFEFTPSSFNFKQLLTSKIKDKIKKLGEFKLKRKTKIAELRASNRQSTILKVSW